MHQLVADEVKGESLLSMHREAKKLSRGKQNAVVGIASNSNCTTVRKKSRHMNNVVSTATLAVGLTYVCTTNAHVI